MQEAKCCFVLSGRFGIRQLSVSTVDTFQRPTSSISSTLNRISSRYEAASFMHVATPKLENTIIAIVRKRYASFSGLYYST